jgi:hypothetical protein
MFCQSGSELMVWATTARWRWVSCAFGCLSGTYITLISLGSNLGAVDCGIVSRRKIEQEGDGALLTHCNCGLEALSVGLVVCFSATRC